MPDPELLEIEERLTEKLGTRVQIERKDYGGKVVIDFFSHAELRQFLSLVSPPIKNEMGGGEKELEMNLAPTPEKEEEKEEGAEELYSVKNFSI